MNKAARLPMFRGLSALLAITLIVSLSFAAPAGRGSKSKKASARSAQKKGKASARKSSSRKSKVSARKSKSRSSRVNARVSKRGRGKRGGRAAYARGRRLKTRYRSQPTIISSYGRGTGVHRYLTDIWTKSQATPPASAQETGAEPEATTPAENVSPGISAAQPALTLPATTAGAEGDLAPPVNPLVFAYEESLAARGFSADNQGFIIATMDGEVLAEHNGDRLFNPASVTKVATSLTAIARLGPDFRFRTTLYTNGALNPATGVLHGSLYIIGSGDPAFFYENAIMIADKLNRAGIREIEGDLVVLGQFYFGFSGNLDASARAFRTALSPDTWNTAAKNAYPRFLSMRAAEDRLTAESARQSGQTVASTPWPASPPSLKIQGKTITSPVVNTGSLSLIAVHTSLPLVNLLKGLNDFSNNWMAHVIGNLVGGPDAVERFLQTDVGFKAEEVKFATSSGLGANYISPRGTVTLLKKLITYLSGKGLKLEDILPVAGIDGGTLQRRFTDHFRGSVVAKTGTLSGVSALAGVVHTRSRGPLLFVIYNRGGSSYSFRAIQDETLKKIITLFGGPVPVHASPMTGPRISQRSAEQSGQPSVGAAQRQ
jgi:serine-type D-Ala-D-Ala carboxypeptidase/endopeptidase (penicillin-binding protein 4)